MATARLGPPIPPPPPWLTKPKAASLPTKISASISSTSLSLNPFIYQFQNPKHTYLSHSSNSRQKHLSCLPHWSFSFRTSRGRERFPLLAVVDGESAVAEEIESEGNVKEKDDNFVGGELKKQPTPCELYVCNLPRSYDISELLEMFKPFGTVLSVEVSRNAETGVSKGCAYVTMGSINSARKAIAALDKSDVGGRELLVRFSVEMNSDRRNPELLNSAPVKNMIYESPHKLYVGNLRWSTKPEDLRKEFSQFGTVVSARILYDRKGGKNRAYAFLSFSSAAERDASISLDGTEFRGRVLVVRKGIER